MHLSSCLFLFLSLWSDIGQISQLWGQLFGHCAYLGGLVLSFLYSTLPAVWYNE